MASRPSKPHRRILRDPMLRSLDGNPYIAIEQGADGTRVYVHPRQWGWGNVERLFLAADCRCAAVERYAHELLLKARNEAAKAERHRHAKPSYKALGKRLNQLGNEEGGR